MHSLVTGGVEMAVLSAIPLLDKYFDLRVLILGRADSRLVNLLDRRQQSLLTIVPHPAYTYPFRMHEIQRRIDNFCPDILVSSLWRSAWVAYRYKKRNPQVKWYCFLHNTHFFHLPDRFFNLRALQHGEVVLTDSQATRAFVQGLLKKSKPIQVLPMLLHSSSEMLSIRTPQVHDCLRFVFMGRIHGQKQIPKAISFLAKLKAEGFTVQFDIFGRPDGDEDQVRKSIVTHQLEQEVRFCGELTGINHKLLTNYHFYLQFSRAEGMAMSVVEAMQQGLVCLVTPVGEIAHYSKHGVSALWLQNEDQHQLVEEVKALVKHPEKYKAMAQQAYLQFKGQPSFAESLVQVIQGEIFHN